MSRSLMYDLYFGNLIPWERGRAQDPAYNPLTRKVSDLYTRFQETLSPGESKMFEELGYLQAEMDAIEEVDLFEYALCMGMLIMIEVFAFKEKRLTERENE